MATLFDQPPRYESLTGIMEGIHCNARRFGFPEKMRPDDWHALCDLTRTALAVQSANVLDEQLAGFGNILSEIASALASIAEAIDGNGGYHETMSIDEDTNVRTPRRAKENGT